MKKSQLTALSLMLLVGSACITGGCSASANSTSGSDSSEIPRSESSPATLQISADTSNLDQSYQISDTLYGIFLEDINYAVDGGLYAELIKNRSFEYGDHAANANRHGWISSDDSALTFDIIDGTADGTYLNENNPTYARITNTSRDAQGISNVGYLDGLSITSNTHYTCSVYLKSMTNTAKITVSLEGKDGTVYSKSVIDGITDGWQQFTATLTPNTSASCDVLFTIRTETGSVDMDMVSLIPEDTYKGLPIRRDLGEYIEALNPSFLRFPGGCVIEGRDEASIYNWKDSVGSVETRPQGESIWAGNKTDPYYTTYGIGFYEYFELCEVLGCMPVPVLNAGMTCQVQSSKYIVYPLDSDEFRQYVQDALDLVEFCRGGADTTWGAVRISMGHEKPFDLRYIAIGNEQWQAEYHAHYAAFVEAFDAAAAENPDLYGDIELIVANGTSSSSTEGWTYLDANPDDITTLVDEHYYETPNWFLTNTNRYDTYDRDSQASVFLGEYAAQANTLEAALAEASYMTGLERNSDLVKMACYAPLFGNGKTNQWTPDMIFFSNDSVYGSVNYYVQQLFSNNVGTTILPSVLNYEEPASSSALHGAVGLGTWCTSAAYDNLCVVSTDSGETLYSCDFESDTALKDDGWNLSEGDWSIEGGRLIQSSTADPANDSTGDSIYIGESDWSNYTLTVDAEILGGSEGFLIPVCVENTKNNIFWNIGGWGNTVSCLQTVSAGTKSGQVSGTVNNLTLKKNQVYQLKVVVTGSNIKCYIDDMLYVDYSKEAVSSLYQTCSVDASGDIIVKLVNVSDGAIPVEISLGGDTVEAVADGGLEASSAAADGGCGASSAAVDGGLEASCAAVGGMFDLSAYNARAVVTTLGAATLSASNSFAEPEAVVPQLSSIEISKDFTYQMPAYTVAVIRIERK